MPTPTAQNGGITDLTITSATGSSQQLVAANSQRASIYIKAGAAVTAVNLFGGTAAIGGAGCITLLPYEFIYRDGRDCPLGVINLITTVANYVSAIEGT